MSGEIKYKMLTIKAGESETEEFELNGGFPVAIVVPLAWTAANVTFRHVDPEGEETPIGLPDGSEVVVVANSHATFTLSPNLMLGCFYRIKIRSGEEAAPVNQAADRIVKLVYRAFG